MADVNSALIVALYALFCFTSIYCSLFYLVSNLAFHSPSSLILALAIFILCDLLPKIDSIHRTRLPRPPPSLVSRLAPTSSLNFTSSDLELRVCSDLFGNFYRLSRKIEDQSEHE